ncbi:MAG: oxygen-independent coproporphyrinogen III oxidase [Bacteroidetes bacterium]|nr:oxygen-independent coproporphyrinogen III oxidase [Bacteroidota bacterium]
MDKLHKKYHVPVPRYTSYPPANYFSEDFTSSDYVSTIEDPSNRSLSIYIHIPFCYRICHYCGCNSYSMRPEKSVQQYVDAVIKEMDMVFAKLDKGRKISQIHYGGGSPTSINIKHIERINNHIFSNLKLIEKPEIAIECHPGYMDKKYISSLLNLGFTRFSLGIQDFNDDVLKCCGRTPSLLPVEQVVELLRSKGATINMDFIYGLPHQTIENFSESIKKAIAIRPERIVTFCYAHLPSINPRQRALEEFGFPTNNEKIEIFETASKLLHEAGYIGIGFDHFVLPEDELADAVSNGMLHRNFQGYCTRRTTGDVFAFGVTAISQLYSAYSQNIKDIDKYMSSIENGEFATLKGYKLSESEQITREVIESIMCNSKVSFSNVANHLNISVEELKQNINYDIERIKEFVSDEIITFDGDTISVTEKGVPYVRNIASSFDKLMLKNTKIFSKA